MKSVSFTEFRKNASAFLNLVENGETVKLYRHGRAVAEIVPSGKREAAPAWKQPGLRLVAPGVSLAKAVLTERRSSH